MVNVLLHQCCEAQIDLRHTKGDYVFKRVYLCLGLGAETFDALGIKLPFYCHFGFPCN